MGYPDGTKGYKVFDIETSGFLRTKDLKFEENKFHKFVSVVDKDRSQNDFILFPVELDEESEIDEEWWRNY